MIKDMNILYEDTQNSGLCQTCRSCNPKQTHRLPGHGEPFKKSYQHDFW